jgi:hypothetical protein
VECFSPRSESPGRQAGAIQNPFAAAIHIANTRQFTLVQMHAFFFSVSYRLIQLLLMSVQACAARFPQCAVWYLLCVIVRRCCWCVVFWDTDDSRTISVTSTLSWYLCSSYCTRIFTLVQMPAGFDFLLHDFNTPGAVRQHLSEHLC